MTYLFPLGSVAKSGPMGQENDENCHKNPACCRRHHGHVVYDLKLYCNHRQKAKEVLELSETLSTGARPLQTTFSKQK